MCTRIQRRNTASNRGDKTACFKVVSLPAERLLNTFWQGGKWSTELWMVSLFKSQRLFTETNKNKTQLVVWTNGALKLSLQSWKRSQFQTQLCIRYIYTAINRGEYLKLGLFEYYGHTHKDVHLGMNNVSHACRPVLYIVFIYSSAVVLHHVC